MSVIVPQLIASTLYCLASRLPLLLLLANDDIISNRNV